MYQPMYDVVILSLGSTDIDIVPPLTQLRKRPLSAVEFVAPLSKIDPIYKEEEEAYKVHPPTYMYLIT